MPKSDNAEMRERVNAVLELIVRGLSSHEIVQYSTEKTTWNVTERQIRKYIRKANKALEQAAAGTIREREIGKAIRRFELLFTKSFTIQDYKTCRQIQGDLNNLLGLDAPDLLALVRRDGKDLIPPDAEVTITYGSHVYKPEDHHT